MSSSPNLLMSKVLKQKYFPNDDLFQVQCKAGDSWLWRSWNAAKFLLKEGSSWQIGTGGRIRIWEDRWVQDTTFRCLQSIRPEGCTISRVKELMNPDQAGWNDSLLYQLFNAADVQAIKNTPISILGLSDKLLWSYTTSGQYSVKTGYKFAKELDKRMRGSEGTSTDREKEEAVLWKRLWSLNIKKKVQHFLWRACHNKISVSANLRKRGLRVDDVCHQCGEEVETVEHLLFHCKKAQLLWKLAPVQWDGLVAFTDSLKDWWRKQGEIGRNGAMDERHELTAYIMWQTWKARNLWLYNSESRTELEIIQRAWTEWTEFKAEQTKREDSSRRLGQVTPLEPWHKPANNTMKLNVCSDTAGCSRWED